MTSLSYVVADVFTETAYAGNSVAVILANDEAKPEDLSAKEMQKIASEFNLSKTVFVLPPQDEGNDYAFRFFTPIKEIPFAGHPTIGAMLVLARDSEPDIFLTEQQVGVISVDVESNRGLGKATLLYDTAPQVSKEPISARVAAGLLGLNEQQIYGDAWAVTCGSDILMVELRDMEALAAASFDYDYWRVKESDALLGQIYCYTGEVAPGGELRARMFAPATGVGEDPATGSAAVGLAGLLATRTARDGSYSWRIHQGIEIGRPSQLLIEAHVDGGEVRQCSVAGSAVIVAEGKIVVPSKAAHLSDASDTGEVPLPDLSA